MSTKNSALTHFYLDGACIVCDRPADSDRPHSTEVYLQSGELVYWTIALPGHGIVDETFAPTQAEARKIAIDRHGKSATIRLDYDRLPLATTAQRYSANPILAAVQRYGQAGGSRVWADGDLASWALACLCDPETAHHWTPELYRLIREAQLNIRDTDEVIAASNEAEEILTRLDRIRIATKES